MAPVATITTSVYQKATHTKQYLSFMSYHPMAHNLAVVRTVMSRVSTLSSLSIQRLEEEEKIVEALRGNGYPSTFIHQHHKHSCPTRHRQEVVTGGPEQLSSYPTLKVSLRQ